MEKFGVSLSVKQCRNFGVSASACLKWLLDSGFKRFRLMSYWDECEPQPGHYDFTELDRQFKTIARHGGTVSLCLGAKQPRWPEAHWPDWAWELPKAKRTVALLKFNEAVVKRYQKYNCLVDYQLENEALLNFGKRIEIDRGRLRSEFQLVKKLDDSRPIIMSTSTTWGIPVRQPIPDRVGFSLYQVLYRADLQRYTTAFHKAWFHRGRAAIIKMLWRKPSFIHELQLEPWGPGNIWEMPFAEQMKSMGVKQIRQNLALANQTKLKPIDLWGSEWWYWSLKNGHSEIAEEVLFTVRLGDSTDSQLR